jgi:hypothetical protein
MVVSFFKKPFQEAIRLHILNRILKDDYLKHPDSEFQVTRFKLFHKILYSLDSVRHGYGGTSSLNKYTSTLNTGIKYNQGN